MYTGGVEELFHPTVVVDSKGCISLPDTQATLSFSDCNDNKFNCRSLSKCSFCSDVKDALRVVPWDDDTTYVIANCIPSEHAFELLIPPEPDFVPFGRPPGEPPPDFPNEPIEVQHFKPYYHCLGLGKMACCSRDHLSKLGTDGQESCPHVYEAVEQAEVQHFVWRHSLLLKGEAGKPRPGMIMV